MYYSRPHNRSLKFSAICIITIYYIKSLWCHTNSILSGAALYSLFGENFTFGKRDQPMYYEDKNLIIDTLRQTPNSADFDPVKNYIIKMKWIKRLIL